MNNSNESEKATLSLWIEAQQQIFARNREGSIRARALLAELPANVPQLLKEDMQYSIAASYLYEGTSKEALMAADQFAILAKNTTYPWHEWAKYSQYRALNIAVNHMVQNDKDHTLCAKNTPCRSLSEQAYLGMLSLSKSTNNQQIKKAAIDYIDVISRRTSWRAKKAYDVLLQKLLNHIDKKDFKDFVDLSLIAKAGRSNELSSWINDVLKLRISESHKNYPRLADGVFKNSYNRWKTTPKNFAWLWLAIYTIKYADPGQQRELTQAALNITPSNPAFVPLRTTLVSRFADLHELNMNAEQKRSIIDETLAVLPKGKNFSATILLLNERVDLATSLTDFVEHAFFYPKHHLLSCVSPTLPQTEPNHHSINYIITNAAQKINMLPASVLRDLVKLPSLPDNYRPVIYVNLWVRSILSNNRELEKEVRDEALKYNPVLTETITKMTDNNNQDERKTLFLTALLHYPNLSPVIDLKRYQTWQGDDKPEQLTNSIVLRHERLNTFYNNWLWYRYNMDEQPPAPTFLTSAQQAEYQEQLRFFNDLNEAAVYISDSLVELANRHPRDLHYAKLLATFIRYTKYSSGSSKKAFQTLKRIYSDSSWAKRTKYYY